MKKFIIALAAVFLAGAAGSAMGATFSFHGDLNNRFNLYSNRVDFYGSAGSLEQGVADTKVVGDKETNTTWGDVKYRLWTEAATNDGAVKGVYAIELGAMRFGRGGTGKSQGAAFSGDGLNIETRWAYTDFQIPGVESKARVKIGLQPFSVNKYVWQETAAGVLLDGAAYGANYTLAWMRGRELFNSGNGDNNESLDSFVGRVDLQPTEEIKTGLFVLYQHENADGPQGAVDAGKYGLKQFADVDMNIYTLGVDGSFVTPTSYGNAFVNWDAMYQTGEFDNVAFTGVNGGATGEFDLSAYFLHGDVGVNVGRSRITYTAWYASGDDDANDKDFDAFLATDVDMFDSIVLFEGGYTDDNYGTERPYLLDKGLFLQKLAVDHKATDKLKFGVAALYLMTAEDIDYVDDLGRSQSEDQIGVEVDGYVSYMLYPNVELAANAGYLFGGDALDFFEINRDGDSQEDLFRSTARVRYKF